MSFLSRVFKRPGPSAGASSARSASPSPHATSPVAAQNASRRELLRTVLSDTLQRQGIPLEWIAGETLLATSPQRVPGIHWRLHIHHWDPRLLTHAVALQQALMKRLAGQDPSAPEWLVGISWQFTLADESVCPPLPAAGAWTAGPAPVPPAPEASVPSEPQESPTSQARADLEKLFAIRDADLRRHAESGPQEPAFEPTQPMFAATEPGRLQ